MKKVILLLAISLSLGSCNSWRDSGSESATDDLEALVTCDRWEVPNMGEVTQVNNVASYTSRLYATNQEAITTNNYYNINLISKSSNPQELSLPTEEQAEANDLGFSDTTALYAGFILFSPKQTGDYSFWINKRTWMDVRKPDGTGNAKAVFFEPFCTESGESYKAIVTFRLTGGVDYTLGFHRSNVKEVSIAITKD